MQTTVMTIYKRVSQSGPSAITDTQGATQQKGKRGPWGHNFLKLTLDIHKLQMKSKKKVSGVFNSSLET